MRFTKFVVVLVLVLFGSMAAFADAVTFTAPTLTDDNGGLFLDGSSFSTGPLSMTINLPNYSASNFDSFFANQVNFALDITPSATQSISGVTVTLFGTFEDGGQATYSFTGGAAGLVNSSPFSVPIPFSLAAGQSLNFAGQLNLDDEGGLASINQIQIDVATVPEPFSLSLMGIGAAAMGLKKRFSARS